MAMGALFYNSWNHFPPTFALFPVIKTTTIILLNTVIE